jgi:UDP-GlcNAc:undecaprenyl-phosphate GlcNAc-1-phosphate transferase
MQISIVFCFAACFSYFLIWIIFKSPLIIFFKDNPGVRKVHQRTIPRIGGLAITTGFLLTIFFWEKFPLSLPDLPPLLKTCLTFATLAIIPVGLADDLIVIGIKNRTKLILEILIAAIIISFFGIRLEQVHFLGWDFSLGWLSIPISILWVVGVTNAINIIDGLDGLAGSVMVVIFATIAVLTGFSDDQAVLFLCVILAGLLSGFLFHNVSPARVFMGDTGSLFLGLIAGLLSLYLISEKQKSYPVVIAPLMLGLPVLDIAVAMWRRFFHKIFLGESFIAALKAVTIADNEHTHHRLIHRGLTHTETVIIMVIFHLSICMSAVLVCFTLKTESVLLLCYILFLITWFLYKLNYFSRILSFLKRMNLLVGLKKETVAVICCDEVLQYSLKKYRQNKFLFSFKTMEEVLFSMKKYCLVIIEQPSADSLDNLISLAGTIFMQSACPVIAICSDSESVPDFLEEKKSRQKSFVLIRKPVYIPALLKEIISLVNQSRGWAMERLAIDTRKFFLQAEMHEKI